ncbi:MAG TPA: TSUP family transporter [Chitinophagaceae bacterium]|nr:TSUP family transporter [Chitinophagaceae bacterium]
MFPVFLRLDRLRVLVVGGGAVGLEKVRSLLRNSPGVRITLVAPEVIPEILALSATYPNLSIQNRAYSEHDLEGKELVLAATDQPVLNGIISEQARKVRVLVNVADTPDLCDFYLGSVVIRGDLKIAISTNGRSPTVAKRIRQVLEESIPEEIDQVLERIQRIRTTLSGDFSEKVRRLNQITSVLVEKNKPIAPEQADLKKLLRFLSYAGLCLGLMIAGYFSIGWILSPQAIHFWAMARRALGPDILYFIAGGFLAKLVDGTLGLGYGTISTSYLLSFGILPAQVSKSVHLSEIFTSGSSGFMHLRYRNVNKKLFRKMVIPGVIGAIGGAFLIIWLEGSVKIIRPVIAVYTLALGINIILKGLKVKPKRNPVKKVGLLALIGGFLDAVAGGGWGTLVTSTLMASGRDPVYVVGSVNLARFYVALAGSLTFISLLGITHWQVAVGLLAGGAVASPIAAALPRKLKSKRLLVLAGLIVAALSLRVILKIF